MTAQSGLGFSGIVAIQIPDQGLTGEVLTKLTTDDYDYDWAAGGGAVQVDPAVEHRHSGVGRIHQLHLSSGRWHRKPNHGYGRCRNTHV